MFKRRTLFIVGAGASEEAKLPTGSKLAMEISKKLDIRFDDFGSRHVGLGDIQLFQNVLRAKTGRIGVRSNIELMSEMQRECRLIRDGIHLANSIDDFLDLHRDNQLLTALGKSAITKCVLEAERNSHLHYDWRGADSGINFPRLHTTWFTKFMKTSARGVPVQKAETIFENISFVVFNYDRCIEHFLLHAVQRLYGMNEQDAASICNRVRIRHPYGVLAPLATNSSVQGLRYGECDRADCAALSANIKTYTEQIEDREELAQIRMEVEAAECLVFLGFAFHEQNMRLLTPTQKMQTKAVYATAFGMSDEDAEVSRNQIARMFKSAKGIQLHNRYKCADLFDNYSKSLAG